MATASRPTADPAVGASTSAGGAPRPQPTGSASPTPKRAARTDAGARTVTAAGAVRPAASAVAASLAAAVANPGISHPVPVSRIAAQVGALFNGGLNGAHHCTASVVDSPGGDLIVTAAHCLGSTSDVFVPGYHDGTAPYGVWRLRRVIVDAQWSASSDQDHDVAFAVVAPENGRDLQSVVGGYALGIGQGTSRPVTMTGYPQATQTPITCTNGISAYGSSQLRIYCTGFTGGTSGGPWVIDGAGSGTVIGVIGGYQQGGDTPDVSYSVAFGPNVQSLYEQAAAAGG
ncbi:trypsin-like serine peptidase [Streptantibioticus ferralitis]